MPDPLDPVSPPVDAYLALLKRVLLDEPYLDNEVRIDYLLGLGPGRSPDVASLRDPARTLPLRYEQLARARSSGHAGSTAGHLRFLAYAACGRSALDHLEEVVARVAADGVAGDLVDCSVGRGGEGIFLRAASARHGLADRTLWVVDRFVAAVPEPGAGPAAALGALRADLNQVRDGYDRLGLLDPTVRFVQGPYRDSLADAPIGPIALLHLGAGLGADLDLVLDRLLPRVVPGGVVVVAGTAHAPVLARLTEARTRAEVAEPMHQVGWDRVWWTVGGAPGSPRAAAPESGPVPVRHRPPLPARVAPTADLSVVVVFYNMRREARRTLHSLSRAYQQGLDQVTYEVLVVENGSAPDQRLTAAEVSAYGSEFRLIDLAGEATSSPTTALNCGVAASRGRNVALMIDGAHVLTPGVLRYGLAALRTYEPAVVATQQWYLGPGQQGEAQHAGYDQTVEDRALRGIGWPDDGYRLFEVGHFIGDRDWFDGIIESNCLFVPRWLLEQVGGFDDSFDMAGGGYANLEIFERLALHPGVNVASILGEGSFHQFHGGTTTNVAEDAIRRVRTASYGRHFAELRGRPLLGLNTPLFYVGSLAPRGARRTRSRRELRLSSDPNRDPVLTTDAEVAMVADEVKYAAIESSWASQAWRATTWLGHPVNRFPTDLVAYQELVTAVRPEVVVLLADDPGIVGRALYLATVLEQLGAGEVVAVGASLAEGPGPSHPRVTWVGGAPDHPDVRARVSTTVGERGAVVFVGLGALARVNEVVEAYLPLVPVHGYLVVENTVVNGRPVAADFGPGPHEAVVSILGRHHDLVSDVAYERYTVTFNKGGYLRRLPPVSSTG